MTILRTRQITLSVAAALAVMTQPLCTHAATGSNVALESVTRLDPALATPSDDAASFVEADRIEGNPEDVLHLYGNAEIRRGGAVLRGDRITYTQATDEVQAEGNALISRQGATFTGPSMRFRITSRTGDMSDADYEYRPRNLRGCAKNIRFISGDKTTFEDAKITTCKRDDEAWFIQLNELEIDEYDQTATGTGAMLHFMGLPLLGSPWFSFPVGNERRSGFLIPTFGMSSGRGVEFSIPYYFNIAPNYDLTLAPRVMSKRGVMLESEARFLYNNFSTSVNYSILPNDRETDEDRYSTNIKANYRRNKLSAYIDYSRVSDDDFLNDFSSTIRESSESVLAQNYSVRYDETYWNATLNVNKNQALDVNDNRRTFYKPYEREPQLLINGYVGDWHGFELSTIIDATRFKNDSRVAGNDQPRIEGDRFVFEQSISYPLRGAGWFVIPKATYLGTWYQLKNIDRFLDQGYTDKNPSRTMPMFSINSGLVFERDTTWFGRSTYQTLEPRIYYAWAPYRDQSDLPVFDSSIADLNFATLFSENVFSGYDRVSEANQLTTVLTTRQFDKATGLELFRASIGQRQYFEDQAVGFPQLNNHLQNVPGSLRTDKQSDLLASVGARLTRSITADVSGQYSSADDRFVKIRAGIRWQPRPMSLVSLAYRYNYANGPEQASDYMSDDIKQVDLAVQWPLTERLYGLFRYNYSLYTHKPIEMIAGVEYLHDCWTLRFAAQRYTTSDSEDESTFFIQLELNGLGSIGTSPLEELRRNIKGYQTSTQVPKTIGQYDFYE